MPDPIVGIDLGTTNSLVAFADAQGGRVLHGPGEDPIVPSVVRYEEDGSVVVGETARRAAIDYPERTIFSAKRLMGRSRTDVENELRFLPYAVVSGDHGTARVAIPGGNSRVVSPPEISAEILRELKHRAAACLDQDVSRVVVTVPAYFDDAQRQATRDAGRLAGLDVIRIVNEPTAAALAYGIGLGPGAVEETVVVYDLGGGTFDVSVLRIVPSDQDDLPSFYQVLSTAGDTHLGGDDVDYALMDLFADEIGRLIEHPGLTPSDLPPATRRAIKEFAQQVKHRLSEEEQARVEIGIDSDRTYDRTFTRAELETILDPWVGRTLRACERALRDANLSPSDVGSVVLVGGSTRIPIVRQRVREYFGREPYSALDPDQVVAIGAAVQAALLAGSRTGSLLLDVVPLSLGIETVGGAVAKLIMRNSTVPARATELFSTSVDGQTSVRLTVVQGEREMVEDCRTLGVFTLSGLPPMPAGIPQLEVEFLVDTNGVLDVSAHERRSGKRATLQVIPNHGLTREEVEQMEAESFEHAASDMTRHRIVDLIVNARLDLKWIGERLERYASLLEDDYRTDLEAQVATLTDFVARAEADWTSVDPNEFHRTKQALDETSVRLQEIGIRESLRNDS